jgi:3'(2'), 5'-bisphosphate nucleotidase
VTVADFTVQALVIDYLSAHFPEDRFIAEEDSAALQSDANAHTRELILQTLVLATGEHWSQQRLFDTLDKGTFAGYPAAHRSPPPASDRHCGEGSVGTSGGRRQGRVWVLDPIDGTKGFLRGEHYCIALALLVDGRPQLSVLGCPNLNMRRVFETRPTDVARMGVITPPYLLRRCDDGSGVAGATDRCNDQNNTTGLSVFPPESGSIYYAVSGRGAHCRSLGMSEASALDVEVSAAADGDMRNTILCESSEASHGNRDITTGVYTRLKLRTDYLWLDGQCKYSVVGAGGAQAYLRLPPFGYRERVWDHAPGSHFVSEARGRVTDLSGNDLDFSCDGRFLKESVTGIIASAGGETHARLLAAVASVQSELRAAAEF